LTTAGRAPLKVAVALGWLALTASPAWTETPAPPKGVVEGGRIAVKWTGDLDGMIKPRVIRVLVAYNKTHYFLDRLNKGLFAFASYNAGPGRVRGLRQTAKARGLDPNLWFNNVERVAAEKIGRETVTYVSNIYKYYIAYKLTIEEMEEKKKALGS